MTDAPTKPTNRWHMMGPRNKQLQVLLSEEEWDAVDFISSELGATKSSWARQVIVRELQKHGFKPKPKASTRKKAS